MNDDDSQKQMSAEFELNKIWEPCKITKQMQDIARQPSTCQFCRAAIFLQNFVGESYSSHQILQEDQPSLAMQHFCEKGITIRQKPI